MEMKEEIKMNVKIGMFIIGMSLDRYCKLYNTLHPHTEECQKRKQSSLN